MLIFVLIAVWAIGAILIATDPGKESTRWAGFMTFVGGFGFLSVFIDDTIRPYVLIHTGTLDEFDPVLRMPANLCSFIEKTGLPYSFLMFAISYCNYFSALQRRAVAIISALPIVFMFCITPLYPDLRFNYALFTVWTGPYILCAAALLLKHYYKERNPVAKRGHLFVNIIGILPLLCYLFTIYILRIFGFTDAWKWNILAVSLMFAAFSFFGIKHDIFGIKLRFEKNRLDSTIRAVTSGSVLLNHTIKNEVGKIHLFLDRIHGYAAESEQHNMSKDIQTIMNATRSLLHLANQFHKQSQDIGLKESSNSLLRIVHETVAGLEPYLKAKQVQVHIDLVGELLIVCDPFHIQETLTNIFINAVEAVSTAGVITVQLNESKKYIALSIVDNGHGIDKQHLPHVFDPFFSTKNRAENYGLGLSYCYNVMQKHGGFLDLHSMKGEGTTVFLHFPKSKLTRIEAALGGTAIETNTNFTG